MSSSGVKEFSVEEFLQYETRGRSEFLGSDWKKLGYLDGWLHRKRPFGAVWQHGIPRIDTKDDPETGRATRMIFTGNYRCLETDKVLINHYKRDRDTGEREFPIEICPPCLMVEHIRMMVVRGELGWLQPVFDFDVGNRDKNILIRATGLFNGYKPAKMSDAQKEELEDAGISLKHAWKDSMLPGLKYIICLVDDAQVGRGVQIMKEGQALGDKIKVVIAKEVKRSPKNPKLGDPTLNPYAFRFEYDDSKDFSEKYDVSRVDIDITPEILELITGDAPDISRLDGRYSPETLRSMLERCCLIPDLPWDEWFSEEACKLLAPEDEDFPAKGESPKKAPPPPPARGRAVAPAGRQAAPAPRGRAPEPRQTQGAPEGRRAAAPPARSERSDPKPAPRREPEPEMFECDCGQPIAATEAKCKHCGREYEVETPAAPAPPPLRKRSEAGGVKPAPRGAPPARNGERGRAEPPRATRRDAASAPQKDEAQERVDDVPPEPEMGSDADVGFGEFGNDEIPF